MKDTSQIQIELLSKMVRRRCWKGKHTSFHNLQKSFPKHLRGDVKNAAVSLIKKGYIVQKPTGYGLEVSLNSRRIDEILRLMEKSYRE